MDVVVEQPTSTSLRGIAPSEFFPPDSLSLSSPSRMR